MDPDIHYEMTVECAREQIYMPELIERMWDAYGRVTPAVEASKPRRANAQTKGKAT
jgi:hypothetical protein